MKKLLFLTATAFGTAVLVRRLVPAERRAQLREDLVQMPATMMEKCMDAMPEDSPPKVMTSGIRRMQEQNDELVALFREQNKLMRKQNDLLQAVVSAAESQG